MWSGDHPFSLVRSEMEMKTVQLHRLVPQLATFIFALLAYSPTMAGTFSGDLPIGYSANAFQIGQGTSLVAIDISALGVRDPTLCASCYSSYTDNYTVEFFGPAGTLLSSQNAQNSLYYSMYTSSHGIGAGPVWIAAPTGATTLEILSNLSVSGLLLDGSPLDFGDLSIVSNGSLTAATPIPSSLVLLAPVLAALGLFGWRRGQKTTSLSVTMG
jgi:hypothetical protein